MSEVEISTGLDVEKEQLALRNIASDVLAEAKKQGADSAAVNLSIHAGFSVTVRMGEVETVEYNRDKGIGITVYFGQQKGSASTTDTQLDSLRAAVTSACAIAQATGIDDCAGLADAELMANDYPDLALYYPWNINPEIAIERAIACEAKGLAFDKRIVNSEGASISSHSGVSVYANSHGFIGSYPTSRHGCSVVYIASDGKEMQRDYDYTSARDASDLLDFDKVALDSAARTVKRLSAQQLGTIKTPVIFDSRVASSLLGTFIQAISGGNLYRKSSFLVDSLGQQLFPKNYSISENPYLLKGNGSVPYDGEGVRVKQKYFIENGVLNSYVLGSYSARKLGLQTTGNAGGVHNLSINTSQDDLAALCKRMDKGLLVTELMGQGTNIVTGDYSRGASGYWIENGMIQYPVQEITIAGNLRDMFSHIVAIGNDVDQRGNIHCGSILLEEMTVAGN